jgi:hypothetical protein
VPHIVDYGTVLQILTDCGHSCAYHKSGSFAPQSESAQIVGWALGDDPTIRADMRSHLQVVPSLSTLLDRLSKAWTVSLRGEIWIMPASHWAFELTYGNADWLPQSLQAIGIDPQLLAGRNDGTAIAFAPGEADPLRILVSDLLTRSRGSDFTAAWPGHSTVAMLHHHGQIWWRTTDVSLADSLRLPLTTSDLQAS